nr:MAG TPA: hypothetical protein [Caudoviricetes sp.]
MVLLTLTAATVGVVFFTGYTLLQLVLQIKIA